MHGRVAPVRQAHVQQGLARAGHLGKIGAHIEVFEVLNGFRVGVPGRIGVASNDVDDSPQASHDLAVIRGRALLPRAIVEELLGHHAPQSADGGVDIVRSAQDPSRVGQCRPCARAHVGQLVPVAQDLVGHQREHALDISRHRSAGLGSELLELAAGGYQTVGFQQRTGDVQISPPGPARSPEARTEVFRGDLACVDNLLPEGVVEVVAIARVDL